MSIFIVLWLYLLTTQLRCLQKNNIGHTKGHDKTKISVLGPLLLISNLTFKNLKIQIGTDENSKDAIYVMKGSKVKFEYCHINSPVNTVLYAIDENSQIYMYGCVLELLLIDVILIHLFE